MWNKIKVIDSADSNVKKYVFEKVDAIAESVLYKYPTYEKRTVICCSTMSGCPVGCRFCGAGDYFARRLSSEEIVSQPVRLLEDTGADPEKIEKLQIMFMSMGEPMLNIGELIPALHELYGRFPNAKLLISTSGPKADYDRILDAAMTIPTIGLQFSVHESTDEARDKLIPYKRKLSLEEIAFEGKRFATHCKRKPFFNYCVHNENNSNDDADRLLGLFDPAIWEATISVICERDEHIAAANERQRGLANEFMGKMIERGFSVRMFDPAGQDDIGGGCGQLWFVQDWMKNNPGKVTASVGCGRPSVHTPRM